MKAERVGESGMTVEEAREMRDTGARDSRGNERGDRNKDQ